MGIFDVLIALLLVVEVMIFTTMFVKLNGLDNVFIDYRYPVNTEVKNGTEVIVVMVEGKKKYKDYILLDKETKKVLSDYRTRFDLIDC